MRRGEARKGPEDRRIQIEDFRRKTSYFRLTLGNLRLRFPEPINLKSNIRNQKSDRVLAASHLHIHQAKIRSLTGIRWMNGNNVLVLFGTNLQFDDIALIVSFAL